MKHWCCSVRSSKPWLLFLSHRVIDATLLLQRATTTYYLLPTILDDPTLRRIFQGDFFWWFSMSKSVVHWEFRLYFSSSPLQDFATTWSFFVKLMAQISCLEDIRRGNLILKTILLSSERRRSQDGFVTFFTSCHSLVWHLVKTVGVWGYYCLVRNTSTKFNFQTERLSWQKKVPFWYLGVLTKST